MPEWTEWLCKCIYIYITIKCSHQHFHLIHKELYIYICIICYVTVMCFSMPESLYRFNDPHWKSLVFKRKDLSQGFSLRMAVKHGVPMGQWAHKLFVFFIKVYLEFLIQTNWPSVFYEPFNYHASLSCCWGLDLGLIETLFVLLAIVATEIRNCWW